MTLNCDACAEPARFLDWNLECSECAKGSPLERAAKAINDLDPQPSMKWERTTNFWRNTARRDARAALTAAVDVDELATLIGPDHAAIVHNHLLGSQP